MPWACSVGQIQRRLAGMGTAGVDHRHRDIVEGLAATGAEVEYAGLFGVIEEPQIDLDHVFDRNKVAALLAIGVAIAAFEQLHLAVGLYWLKKWNATEAMRPLCCSRGPYTLK